MLSFYLPFLIFSQNLILDGDFENNKTGEDCDYGLHTLSNTWGGFGTCQLFKENECLGSSLYLGTIVSNALSNFELEPVKPFSGDYLAAIRLFDNEIEEWREFIYTRLQNNLENGSLYKISFYVKISATENFISNDFGIGFSPYELEDQLLNNPFDPNNPKPYNFYSFPYKMYDGENLDHIDGWKKVEFYYEASGNEKDLIIGNFKSDNNTEKIQIQNCNACRPGALIYIDLVTIDKCQINSFSFQNDSLVICSSDTLNINLSDYPYSFKWFDNDTNKIKTFKNSGDYSIEYFDEQCSVRDSFYLYKLDTINKIQSILLCGKDDLPITIDIDIPYHSNNVLKLNNNVFNGEQIVISEFGSYSLEVVNNQCKEQREFTVLNENDNLTLYPNPTTDILFVNRTVTSKLKYNLYDGLGRLVISDYIENEIDISNLASGTYIISFPNNCIENLKIIKY